MSPSEVSAPNVMPNRLVKLSQLLIDVDSNPVIVWPGERVILELRAGRIHHLYEVHNDGKAYLYSAAIMATYLTKTKFNLKSSFTFRVEIIGDAEVIGRPMVTLGYDNGRVWTQIANEGVQPIGMYHPNLDDTHEYDEYRGLVW